MAIGSGIHRIIGALRNPNYGVYAAGNIVSLTGFWMQRVAVGWLIWELTESGTWLGLIAFALLFPTVLISPFAGAAADRWNRLTVIKINQVLALVVSVVLFVVTALDVVTPWLLLTLTLCHGIIGAFNQPARLAIVPSLVPERDISAAVAINSVIFNMARFVGPAAAGIVIVTLDVAAAFAANAASYAVFLYALSRIRIDREERPAARDRSLFGDIHDGLVYVAGHRTIAALLALLVVSSLCARPVVELLPGFASAVFGGDAGTLAILTSTIGIGAVVGGLWLAGRPSDAGLPVIVFSAVGAMAVALLAFVATTELAVAIPALAVAGFCFVVNGVGSQTLIQLRVDPAMRGRVLSLYGLIFRAGPAAGALGMGAFSEIAGLRVALTVGAVLTLAVAVATWIVYRRMRGRPQSESSHTVN